MIVQKIYSSVGLLMTFEASTPAEAEANAQCVHKVVHPHRIEMQRLHDEFDRKGHPFRTGKTAKDRKHPHK